jgi:hypothetical protein
MKSFSTLSTKAAWSLVLLLSIPYSTKAQAPGQSDTQASDTSPARRQKANVPSGPTPRVADGHPDLSGYWKDDGNAKPHGNIGKDLPGFRLPFTTAGEAAHRYNVEHTVDPESLCLQGGLPREDAGDGGFQLLQVTNSTAFLYGYGTFRVVATDGRKHSEDPDPTFFGEDIGSWESDTLVVDSVAFKDTQTWADENANPHSDALHTIERWTRPDAGHLHLELTIEDSKNIDVNGGHLGFGPGPIRTDGTRGYDHPAPLLPPPSKEHPAVTSVLD